MNPQIDIPLTKSGLQIPYHKLHLLEKFTLSVLHSLLRVRDVNFPSMSVFFIFQVHPDLLPAAAGLDGGQVQ